MALTAIKVLTDKKEYSRFESDRSIVKARVIPDPSTEIDGEVVTVELIRKSGLVIASEEVTFSTSDYSKGVVLTFDLTELVDDDGFPLALRGDYTVQARQGDVTASAELRIALLTAAKMKKTYCLGLTLRAAEVMQPRHQPRLVSGVRIVRCSDELRPGLKSLAYLYNSGAPTLTFAGGATVELDESITEEILPDSDGNYVEVEIDYFDLPDDDIEEVLVIDQEVMEDAQIQGFIDQAIAEMENETLDSILEPSRVATEPYYSSPEEGEHFDRLVRPAAYYRGDFNERAKAWHVSLPLLQIVKIDAVSGYMGNSKALDITKGQLAVSPRQGTLDVMPFDSQYQILWQFQAQQRMSGDREVISQFWRYKGVAGLEPEGDILKAIGYIAAIPILSIAGQAYRAGYTSESVSKDGVSSSKSYTSSAVYGIYSATINDYEKWLKSGLKQLRKRYRGLVGAVL